MPRRPPSTSLIAWSPDHGRHLTRLELRVSRYGRYGGPTYDEGCDSICRLSARRERRRRQPQDGRGGQGVLEDAGFTNVRTILATGNVLLDSRSGVDAVRKKAEKALRDGFGYDAWVLAYDLDTVRTISERFPFEREVDGHHSYVTFVTDSDVLDELAELGKGPGRREDRARRGRRLLAGAQQGHAGHHHRQDDGKEALQVVDDHPQPAHRRESSASR